jgi:glycosyltransferase involved in cell wall biosynthesis
MRVIVLSQWYPPEPESKIHLLARDLVARGHQVTTITGFPNYPVGQIYPGYKMRWHQWEMRDAVRVLRLPLYPSHDRSGSRRALNYLSFALSASMLGLLLAGPADVMWVYHPPLTIGLPATIIGALRRIPFIYEVQDMWPETLTATGMFSSPRIAALLGAFARFVYRRAAAITVISEGFRRNLISKGVPADKINVISNWADEELFHPVPADAQLADAHGLTGKFNLVFAGNMGAAQGLENLLAAAEQLRDLPQLQFALIGDGVDVEDLKRLARERGLLNVKFIDRQPAAAMPKFFALADALLVHLRAEPLFRITIPSKTIAYLACGRPILAVTEGDAADLVRKYGAGLVCPPEDPSALAATIRRLYHLTPQQRAQMGEAGRRAYLSNFTRQSLMDRYEMLFTSVSGRGMVSHPVDAQ